jgi:ATP-dependent 26S proteasome regulatory subunit
MSDVYLVQHKNGNTKVFVVDGLTAYLCRDGHIVHTEQLPKTGIARSWARYMRLAENSEVAIKARQCVLDSRSKKRIAQEHSRQIIKTVQEEKAEAESTENLRRVQLQVGDFIQVLHLHSHVLAKVVGISRVVHISKFFRKQNVCMPKKKLDTGWVKISEQQANQFMNGAKWRETGVCV